MELLERRQNVLVARTLSKGYGLGRPAIWLRESAIRPSIAQMTKVKDSYNCDAIAIVAACAALDDQEHARASWQAIRAERTRIAAALERRRFAVIPSQGNFLLTTTPDAVPAGALYAALKSRGVLVRFFDTPALRDKLRISIGTREDNDALLAALDSSIN